MSAGTKQMVSEWALSASKNVKHTTQVEMRPLRKRYAEIRKSKMAEVGEGVSLDMPKEDLIGSDKTAGQTSRTLQRERGNSKSTNCSHSAMLSAPERALISRNACSTEIAKACAVARTRICVSAASVL